MVTYTLDSSVSLSCLVSMNHVRMVPHVSMKEMAMSVYVCLHIVDQHVKTSLLALLDLVKTVEHVLKWDKDSSVPVCLHTQDKTVVYFSLAAAIHAGMEHLVLILDKVTISVIASVVTLGSSVTKERDLVLILHVEMVGHVGR